jgi:hypothetical protein
MHEWSHFASCPSDRDGYDPDPMRCSCLAVEHPAVRALIATGVRLRSD